MSETAFDLIEFKALDDEDRGLFAARIAVIGNVDRNGDRIMPGAFDASLKRWQESGKPIPVIWSHGRDDPSNFIGQVDPADVHLNGKEVIVGGQFDMSNPKGKQAFGLLKSGLVDSWSFGYQAQRERLGKDLARELLEVDIFELGPTLVGANAGAKTLAVKSALVETKAAIAVHHTETYGGSWDGPANEARLPNTEAALTRAHAWRDANGDPEAKASYRFIHHTVDSSGAVGPANTTACSTGIGVLNGGRGGTTIPAADIAGVHAHLAAHMQDANMEAPELKAAEPETAVLELLTKELASFDETVDLVLEEKIGRLISSKTEAKVRQAIAHLQDILAGLVADEEPTPTEAKDADDTVSTTAASEVQRARLRLAEVETFLAERKSA